MREKDTQAALDQFNKAHPTFNESQKIPEFYHRIIKEFQLTYHDNIGFLVVGHLLHTLPYLLHALSKMGKIIGLAPKSSATPPDVSKTIRSLYKNIIHPDLNKENLKKTPKILEQYLENVFKENPELKLVIVDHGGYFAPRMMDVIASFKDRILAILEHTGNGEAKHKSTLPPETPFPVPIFSVANSELKRKEDAHIGHSIGLALGQLLSAEGLNHDISCFNKIVIIGFGNIGQSVAQYICDLGLGPKLCIYDSDEKQRDKARKIPKIATIADNPSEAFANADLVFLAICRGVAIKKEALPVLSQRSLIVCVTSEDDLLEPNTFKGNPNYKELQLPAKQQLTAFQHITTQQTIYLAAGGAAANFVRGGTAHPIIHAIFASQCVIINNLISSPPLELTATIRPSCSKQDKITYEILKEVCGDIETHATLRFSTDAAIQTDFSVISPILIKQALYDTPISLSASPEQRTTVNQLQKNSLTEQEAFDNFARISNCLSEKYSQALSAIIEKLERQPLLMNIAAAYIGQQERKLKATQQYLAGLMMTHESEESIQTRVIRLSVNYFFELGGQPLLQCLAILNNQTIPLDLIETYFSIIHENSKTPGGHTINSLIKTGLSLALINRSAIDERWKTKKFDDTPYYSIHPDIQQVINTIDHLALVSRDFLSIIIKTAYQWLQNQWQDTLNTEAQQSLLIHVEKIINHVTAHYKATADHAILATDLATLVPLFVRKKIELGDKFYFQKNTVRARSHYEDALRYDPDNVDIHLKRIDMLIFFREELATALKEIHKIMQNKKHSFTQYLKMLYQESFISIRIAEPSSAIKFLLNETGQEKHCFNSVELLTARIHLLFEINLYDPVNGCINIMSIHSLFGSRVYTQISRCIQRALELEPRNITLLNLQGWLLWINDKNYQAAEKNFRLILETCDEMAKPHVDLAEVLLGQNSYVDALDHIVRACELADTEQFPFVFNKLESLSQHDSCLESLIEALEKLSIYPPLVEAPHNLALVLSLKDNLYLRQSNRSKTEDSRLLSAFFLPPPLEESQTKNDISVAEHSVNTLAREHTTASGKGMAFHSNPKPNCNPPSKRQDSTKTPESHYNTRKPTTTKESSRRTAAFST